MTVNLGAGNHLTYTKQISIPNGSACTAEVWTTPVITGGAMTVSATLPAGRAFGVIVVAGASLVQAGNTNTGIGDRCS